MLCRQVFSHSRLVQASIVRTFKNYGKTTRFDELRIAIQKKIILTRGTMMRLRKIELPTFRKGPDGNTVNFVVPYTLSNLAGHGAFICLAFSYLETDILSLRVFAISGISLSILFQYYREKPLWVPLRWNILFFIINAVMIWHLISEENSVKNLSTEHRKIFQALFEKRGMTPLEFRYLMSIASRREIRKNDRIKQQGTPSNSLFLVQSGSLIAKRSGEYLGRIQPNQFIGEMAFLKQEEEYDRVFNEIERTVEGITAVVEVEETIDHLVQEYLDDYDTITSSLKEYKAFAVTILEYWRKAIFRVLHIQQDDPRDALKLRATISSADVVCTDSGVIYQWDFENLHQLLLLKPSLHAVFERCISADLNKKLINSKEMQPLNYYRSMLYELLADGEISERNKSLLAKYREQHGIDMEMHRELLHAQGWGSDEFNAGCKGGPSKSAIDNYLVLLNLYLAKSSQVTKDIKEKLRLYREDHNIHYQLHLDGLSMFQWSPDEYEAGVRRSMLKQQLN